MNPQNQLSSSLEDYLEAIYIIVLHQGEARSKQIMEQLDVSGPSVTEAFQQLSEKGLIHYTPYEAITLTSTGKDIAQNLLNRHVALRTFFIEVLGIDYKTADEGACKIEHVASSTIIDRIIKYTDYLRKKGQVESGKDSHFSRYLNTQRKGVK